MLLGMSQVSGQLLVTPRRMSSAGFEPAAQGLGGPLRVHLRGLVSLRWDSNPSCSRGYEPPAPPWLGAVLHGLGLPFIPREGRLHEARARCSHVNHAGEPTRVNDGTRTRNRSDHNREL